MSIYGIIFFMFFAVVVSALIIYGLVREVKNNAQPVESHEVQVLAKRKDPVLFGKNAIVGRNGVKTNPKHYITLGFFSSNETREIEIPFDLDNFTVGDRGILKMQGTRFVSFKKT